MPRQLIIDSNNRGPTAGRRSVPQLRPQTRKFGFVPDLERCLAGDLILFCSVSPNWIDKGIASTQDKAGFAADDSKWTHAAVFLYEDFIVEAELFGVRSRSLYSSVPDSKFRVRRRPNLQLEERYKIALCAQRMLGTRYGLRTALSLGWRARTLKMWDRPWSPWIEVREKICSQVFYDAHAAITRHFLDGCSEPPIMPAHLSATADLFDVDVPWLEVI
jgi:hypothetical protein